MSDTGGFGTMNGWLAFKGYIWAKITLRKNVTWKMPTKYYHVVHWEPKK